MICEDILTSNLFLVREVELLKMRLWNGYAVADLNSPAGCNVVNRHTNTCLALVNHTETTATTYQQTLHQSCTFIYFIHTSASKRLIAETQLPVDLPN